MASLSAYAGVARAPFLLLPIALVAAGGAAAAYDGAFDWRRTFAALVGLIALHMAVNIFNEWSDMRTGIDLATQRTPFSGGSGTLPGGAMRSRTAFVFGSVCAAIGLVIGVWFVTQVGWIVVPPFVVGIVCVLGYTEFLARIGVGEIAAGLGLGALPVACTALIQDGSLGRAAWSAAVPAFFMTFNLLLLNEFPDERADRDGGRRNLVIILGRRTAARVYAAAAVATPAAIVAAVLLGWLPALCLAAAVPSPLLLAKPLAWAFADPTQDVPIPALAANVAWILTTNLAMAVTLVLALP